MEKKPQMLIIDPANELKFVGKWIEWKIVLKNDPTFSCQKSLWRLYERKSEEIARSGFLNLSIFSVYFGRFHNLSEKSLKPQENFLEFSWPAASWNGSCFLPPTFFLTFLCVIALVGLDFFGQSAAPRSKQNSW